MTNNTGLVSGSLEKTGSEGLFKIIFNKFQTAIVIIDPKTHVIVDVNPLALEILCRTREDVIGKRCVEFICPTKSGECPVTDKHIDLHGSERILINSRGERVSILKTVAIGNVGGDNYLIESFVDISEQKRFEARKSALIFYLNESIARVKKPMELTSRNLDQIATEVSSGGFDPEEIRMQIQIQANNLRQMERNLQTLLEEVRDEYKDISENVCEFRAGM